MPETQRAESRGPSPSERGLFRGLLLLRILVGLGLIVLLVPLSVDDYFRVYHAIYFWQKPSFSPSTNWLPLYAWLHGPLVGIVDETRLAPRLASLGLGVLGAAFALRDTVGPREPLERPARFLLAICVPTSVLLFALPLSEALAGALVTAHVAALARYREAGRAGDALAASLALLGATATRYEAWALLPLAIGLMVARRPVDVRRWIVLVLAALPMVFPLRWMAHLEERTGDPLSFLGSIERDQFGASPLSEAFLGPSAPLAVGFVVAVAFLALGLVRDVPPRVRLAALYGLTFVGFSGAVAIAGSLPSQLPARLFHLPMLLAVPSMVHLLALDRIPSRGLAFSGLGLVLGLASAIALPGIISPADARVGAQLRRSLAADPRAIAVVEGPFPEITAFVVAANAVGRVQIEGAGGRCRVEVFSCEFRCGRPAWIDSVRYVLVASRGLAHRFGAAGYRERARSPRYRLLERGPASPPLCPDP